MPRHHDARRTVIDYLSTHGPLEDSGGKATSVLKDAVGYQGGDSGFVQLVSAMAKSGELNREVRGKRTYRIWVSGASEPTSPRVGDLAPAVGASVAASAPRASNGAAVGGEDIDYDELATTLLTRVTQTLMQGKPQADDPPWMRRRVERLETRSAVLERDLARARAEAEAFREERDALAAQLEAAQHNLGLLTERLGTPRNPAPRAASHLDTDERALLQQLRGNGHAHKERAKATRQESL